ncbi:MAG: nucleoside-triphosphatase [Anaerolineales bacterium]
MKPGEIIILTGKIQSGKTNFCLDLAQNAKDMGINLAGVLSPGVFHQDEKTGIDVVNLKSWERRRLAVLRGIGQIGIETRRWSFYPEIVDWGNQVLKNAVPCDLLIVDELGPLEFEREEGWIAGISAVDSGEYQTALVVIRPSFLKMANQRWKVSRVHDLDNTQNTSCSSEDILARLIVEGNKSN